MRVAVLMIGVVMGVSVPAWAQSQKALEQAFENAMRDVDAERAQGEHTLGSVLAQDLRRAIQQWLDAARAQKALELHRPIEQRWEQLPASGDLVHHEYFLEECAYVVEGQDVVKTSSLLVPYQATVRVLERLSVSRYHPPNSSHPEQFQYTVTTPITLSLEYRDKTFVVTRTERGPLTFEKGW